MPSKPQFEAPDVAKDVIERRKLIFSKIKEMNLEDGNDF